MTTWRTTELAATHEIDDLDRIALGDEDFGKPLSLDNGEVVLDGHASRVDLQPRQEVCDAHRLVELVLFAVQGNLQETLPGRAPERTALKPDKSR